MSEREYGHHTAEDGSVYALEVVSPEPEAYAARYGVDLVRASTDRYGLEHEQRLRLGEYPSWGEAEEHRRELESVLDENGVEGLGEDARRAAEMPYVDGQYLAAVFPTDGSAGETAKIHLLYLSGEQVTAALVAGGKTEDIEALCGQLDRAWAEGGTNTYWIPRSTKRSGMGRSRPARRCLVLRLIQTWATICRSPLAKGCSRSMRRVWGWCITSMVAGPPTGSPSSRTGSQTLNPTNCATTARCR